MQHHAAIPMRSATGDSKTHYNYAHTSTPKAASSHRYTAAKKTTTRPQPHPSHTRGTFHRRLQPLYTEKHKVSCSGWSPKHSPCNIMQPFQCDLQPEIPKHNITTHTQAHPKVLPFVTTSLRHHFPSSPLPFVTTPLHHHFPSSPLPIVTTSLRHHFPSSPLPIVTTSLRPLPIVTTSLRHHFPSSPLPFVTTSHRHHFPSSPLPIVTTSLRHHFLRHHFPSSPLPIVTTSLRHHFPSSPLPFVTTSLRHPSCTLTPPFM